MSVCSTPMKYSCWLLFGLMASHGRVRVVSRSQTHPYRRRVWTTVNTKLGSGFHQILGVLIGLSRCYVNDRPLVAIAGNRSSWFVSAHGDGEERLLPLLDGSPSKNKDIAVHKCVLTAHKGQKCLQLLIF